MKSPLLATVLELTSRASPSRTFASRTSASRAFPSRTFTSLAPRESPPALSARPTDLATHRLVEALRPALGADVERDVARHVERGERIPIAADFLGPRFTGVVARKARFERTIRFMPRAQVPVEVYEFCGEVGRGARRGLPLLAGSRMRRHGAEGDEACGRRREVA